MLMLISPLLLLLLFLARISAISKHIRDTFLCVKTLILPILSNLGAR